MLNWQPIDTAPHDGTPVLVADCFGVRCAAFDGPPTREEYEDTVGEKVEEDEWQEELQRYSNAWTFVEPITGDNEFLTPSHWMPLPEAPPEALNPPRAGQASA